MFNRQKKYLLSIFKLLSFVVLIFSINTSSSNAEVFTTANPLAYKQMILGAEGQSNMDPDNTRINAYLGYGINSDWDLFIKGGFGTDDPMLGADVLYYLGDLGLFHIAFKGGFYYLDEMFFNLIPIITHNFNWVSLSSGLVFNIQLNDDSKLATNLYAGINFPINNEFDINLEGGLKLTDNFYNWISAGLAYSF